MYLKIKIFSVGMVVFFIIIMAVLMIAQDSLSIKDISYRPATVAGSFYPDNPDSLRNMINKYLKKSRRTEEERDIIGLVAPHAGYVYSGWIAGMGYATVAGKDYDAVIVIAPSHQKSFSGSSVFNGDAYVTPLGNAMVDKELAKKIASFFDEVKYSMDGHQWQEGNNKYQQKSEHSLEVQIPFIQVALPNVPIVPIVMGSQTLESQDFLMRAIVSAVKESEKKVLIVASSDLSHYYSKEDARNIDRELVKAFARFDYYKISSKITTREMEACGGGPIAVMMTAAEKLGGYASGVIRYATSADSPDIKGDSDRVVGYFTGVVVKSQGSKPELLPFLDETDKIELMKAAKNAVERAVKGEKNPVNFLIPLNLSGEFASFVTLRKNGELRGCMGHTFSSSPLYSDVQESARLASLNDPRFPPVRKDELKSIKYEVTVLSRMQRQLDLDSVVVGWDGILLKVGNHSGLFLPVVATEQNWDRVTFLEQVGRKAGLSTDAYKQRNAILYTFRSIVIDSEHYDIE